MDEAGSSDSSNNFCIDENNGYLSAGSDKAPEQKKFRSVPSKPFTFGNHQVMRPSKQKKKINVVEYQRELSIGRKYWETESQAQPSSKSAEKSTFLSDPVLGIQRTIPNKGSVLRNQSQNVNSREIQDQSRGAHSLPGSRPLDKDIMDHISVQSQSNMRNQVMELKLEIMRLEKSIAEQDLKTLLREQEIKNQTDRLQKELQQLEEDLRERAKSCKCNERKDEEATHFFKPTVAQVPTESIGTMSVKQRLGAKARIRLSNNNLVPNIASRLGLHKEENARDAMSIRKERFGPVEQHFHDGIKGISNPTLHKKTNTYQPLPEDLVMTEITDEGPVPKDCFNKPKVNKIKMFENVEKAVNDQEDVTTGEGRQQRRDYYEDDVGFGDDSYLDDDLVLTEFGENGPVPAKKRRHYMD